MTCDDTAMIRKPEKGLFVVGTGTDVGKTYVSCLIVRELHDAGVRVGVYKPVASGCRRQSDELISADAEQLWKAAGKPKSLDAVTPQRFSASLAPNVAARREGKEVKAELLRSGLRAWDDSDFMLVEGIGGLMSPVSNEDLVIDLAADFQMPLLLVVANRLGCINSALLALDVLKQRALKAVGIVLNDVSKSLDGSGISNRSEIERLTDVPIWAHVRFGENDINVSSLLGL